VQFGPNALFVTQSGEFLPEGIHDKVLSVMEKLHLDQDSGAEGNEPLGAYASRMFWKSNDEDPLDERRDVCAGMNNGV
jgi:hypothetical protein